jgi:NAD(P)-dependent dehydrogenase (short-subunit alcohol dehydrogenase family)
MANAKKILIAGIGSDIGCALAEHWLKQGHSVVGTFRNKTAKIEALSENLEGLSYCNFKDKESITNCLGELKELAHGWDALVVCPATMLPISSFEKADIEAWIESFSLNFLSIARFMHGALQFKSHVGKPVVINFAGGGSNSAPHNVSAYVSAKIALTKLTELLAAENTMVKFTILGPGWVKTKIHNEMLGSPDASDIQISETKRRLAEGDFVPMDRILFCCDWLLKSGLEVSGRNFSAEYDLIGNNELTDFLISNENFYKLRRHGNYVQIGVE